MTRRPSLPRGARSFVVLAWFHSRQLLRTSFFVQLAIAAPMSFGLLRILGAFGAGNGVPNSLWLQSAIAGMWATTTTAVGIIGYQRFQGTLEFLAMSTLAPSTVFGSLASAAALIGWLGAPIGIGLQYAFSGAVAVTTAQGLAFISATVACIASACVLAALFVMTRSAATFEPVLLVPVWLMSGIVIPLAVLPDWLHPIALLHPLTGAVMASTQPDLISAAVWSAISGLTSLAWLFSSRMALRVALRRARASGSLALS